MIQTIRFDLLELLGSGYVIEHCIFALSELRRKEIFMSYIADCLKNINDILVSRYGGSYMNERFSSIFEMPEKQEMTGDEIAKMIIEKAGLSIK